MPPTGEGAAENTKHFLSGKRRYDLSSHATSNALLKRYTVYAYQHGHIYHDRIHKKQQNLRRYAWNWTVSSPFKFGGQAFWANFRTLNFDDQFVCPVLVTGNKVSFGQFLTGPIVSMYPA